MQILVQGTSGFAIVHSMKYFFCCLQLAEVGQETEVTCADCLKSMNFGCLWPTSTQVSPRSPEHVQYFVTIDSLVKFSLSLNLVLQTSSLKK